MIVLTDRFGNLKRDVHPTTGGPGYWAQVARERSTVSLDDLAVAVGVRVSRIRAALGLPHASKYKVRVFRTKDGRKQVYMLHLGGRFVVATTWRKLMEKAAWDKWSSIRASNTFRGRWK